MNAIQLCEEKNISLIPSRYELLTTILPDVIHFEILSFLNISDKLEFVKVNRDLFNQLIKQTREIHIRREGRSQEFFTSETYRNKLLNLIRLTKKSLQFSFLFKFRESFLKNLNNSFSLPIACLTAFLPDFVKFSSHIEQVNHLVLTHGTNATSKDINELFSYLSDPKHEIQHFELSSLDTPELPVIPSLETLKIYCCGILQWDNLCYQNYQKLRSLTLYHCPFIVDVANLDYIYDLTLISCYRIKDISSLNHNYKITIDSCFCITNYSQALKHSKIIHLKVDNYYSMIQDTTECQWLEAKELQLKDKMLFPLIQDSLVLPNVLNLRKLTLHSIKETFKLPENNLTEISIIHCPNFRSCQSMGNIYKVSLEKLLLYSLEGLGPNNKVINITECDQINDFTPIQSCAKVSILHCRGFIDATQLSAVSHLHVALVHNHIFPTIMKLEGVHHLEVITDCRLPLIQKMVENIKSLKVVTINAQHHYIESFLDTLCECKPIQKIIIQPKVILQKLCHMSETLENLLNKQFIVENPIYSNESILLRK